MPDRPPVFRPARAQRTRVIREDVRPSAHARGYDRRHEAWRYAVLTRDNWTCRQCGHVCWEHKNAHADHISPVVHGTETCEDGRSRYDPDAGQCLCGTCHRRKTARERTQDRAVMPKNNATDHERTP